jgi:hypothetical protein
LDSFGYPVELISTFTVTQLVHHLIVIILQQFQFNDYSNYEQLLVRQYIKTWKQIHQIYLGFYYILNGGTSHEYNATVVEVSSVGLFSFTVYVPDLQMHIKCSKLDTLKRVTKAENSGVILWFDGEATKELHPETNIMVRIDVDTETSIPFPICIRSIR